MSRAYFTDRDLGKRFGEILKAGGLTVERHAGTSVHSRAAGQNWRTMELFHWAGIDREVLAVSPRPLRPRSRYPILCRRPRDESR